MIRLFVRYAVSAANPGFDGRIAPIAQTSGFGSANALLGASYVLDGVRFPIAGGVDAPVEGGKAGQSHTRRSCLYG